MFKKTFLELWMCLHYSYTLIEYIIKNYLDDYIIKLNTIMMKQINPFEHKAQDKRLHYVHRSRIRI